jgi:hypothetical protein
MAHMVVTDDVLTELSCASRSETAARKPASGVCVFEPVAGCYTCAADARPSMALTAVSVLLQVRDRLLSRSESCKLSSFCRVTCRASSNVECIMSLILVPPHLHAAALRSSTHGVDCRTPSFNNQCCAQL